MGGGFMVSLEHRVCHGGDVHIFAGSIRHLLPIMGLSMAPCVTDYGALSQSGATLQASYCDTSLAMKSDDYHHARV